MVGLEGEVIHRTLARSLRGLVLRSGRCGIGGSLRSSSLCRGSGHIAIYLPSTNIIEPTAIEFVCIDIERHCHHLTSLDSKAGQTIGTEHVKHKFSGELFIDCFQNKRLGFPFTTTSLTNTAALRHDGNDFSC